MIEIESNDEALSTGQRIPVRGDRVLCCHELVEEFVPHVGVMRIREAGLGERKMITTQDYSLRGC